MTKFYSWASFGPGVNDTAHAARMTVGEYASRPSGQTSRKFSGYRQTALQVRQARINFAGLPIRMKLGSQVYEYAERTQLREILDRLEKLAMRNLATEMVSGLLRQSITARKRGSIVITPSYFKQMRHALDTIEQACPDDGGPPERREPVLPSRLAAMADRVLDECARRAGLESGRALLATKTHGAGGTRDRTRTWKHISYWLLKDLIPEAPIPLLAKHIGKDHTTLLHGANQIETYKSLRKKAVSLSKAIRPMVRDEPAVDSAPTPG